MTRRKPVSRRVVTLARPWCEAFKTAFRLAADDWTPPSTVLVRYGSRSWTLTAVFTQPAGPACSLKLRMGLGNDGRPNRVLEETMTFCLRVTK